MLHVHCRYSSSMYPVLWLNWKPTLCTSCRLMLKPWWCLSVLPNHNNMTLQTQHQQSPRGPPVASHHVEVTQLSLTRMQRGRLQGGPREGLWRFVSSEPSLWSFRPPLCLMTFCFTSSGLWQPIWCLHIASSRGTEMAASLVSLGGYRRHASFVASSLISTRGPLATTGCNKAAISASTIPPFVTRRLTLWSTKLFYGVHSIVWSFTYV